MSDYEPPRQPRLQLTHLVPTMRKLVMALSALGGNLYR